MKQPWLTWLPSWPSLVPLVLAFVLQSLCWYWLQPLVWFMFFPAVFLSSWIGGRASGWWATVISTGLVWFFFLPPERSFELEDMRLLWSVVLFICMGGLFSQFHGQMREVSCREQEAVVALRRANETLEQRVSDRVQELAVSQDSIKQSESRLAGIVSSAMDAIISVDAEQRIILFNHAAEIMFGCKAVDVMGQPLDSFIPKQSRQAHRQHIADFGQTSQTSRSMHSLGSLMGVRADGSEFPIEASISQVEVAGQRTYTVILRDITERKRSETAMALLASIVESSVDAIVGKDLNGIVTSWNAGAESMFGYSAEEMLGRSILQIIPPERQEEEDHILRRLRNGERVEHFETERLTKAGHALAVSVTVSPIKDAVGRVVGASKVARNMTVQRQAVEALRVQQRHSQCLLRLARSVERAVSLQDILQAALVELRAVLNLQVVWFYLFTQDRCHLRLINAVGPGQASDSVAEDELLSIKGDAMLEEIASSSELVVVEDAMTDPRTNKEIVTKKGSRTILNMPITMSGRRLGSIGSGTFASEGVRLLTTAEKEFFAALASQVAVALDRIEETDRRLQAELALQEQAKRLHETDRRLAGIVQGMTEACFALDADWRFIFVSDRCEALLKHSREQMLGCSIWTVFCKLIGTPMEKHYRHVMASREPASFEAFSPIAERWLDIRLFPSGDGLAAFLLDIDERKRSQLALQDSEARYRTTLDSMMEGGQIISRDWRYLYVNEAVCQHGRLTADQLLGRTMMEVFPGIDKSDMFQALRRCMKDQTSEQMEHEFVYSDGTSAVFQLYIQPVPEGIFILSLDVTARKRWEEGLRELNAALEQRVKDRTAELAKANEELRQSRAELQSLFESLPGLYLVLTTELKIVAVSDAYLKATMTARESILGRGLFEVFPDNPEDPSANGVHNLRASLERVLKNAVPDTMAIQKYDVRRPDGQFEEHYWSPVNSPVFGADHEIKFIVHRVEEVTDFVKQKIKDGSVPSEMSARLQQMEAEIFKSSQKLQEANQLLEASNNELEAFAYSVSHDLRAPLRAMDGFSKALVEDYGTAIPGEGTRYVQVIRNSARKMGQLIDDLLTFSRLSRAPLNRRSVDTRSVVEAALKELEPAKAGRHVEVIVGDLPGCEGDPGLLKQVWMNLLSNAFKYTQKREFAVVEVGSLREGETVTYFVRDNGAGFDMRYVHKLFGVFQRLHRVEDYEGTGVGLAIVQRVVHRHGGKVWAESVVESGATFYFNLKTNKQHE